MGHGCPVCVGVWIEIIELLIKESLALCRISDTDEREAAADVAAWIRICHCLMQARVHSAHHLTSDHTDFIDDDDLSLIEMCLKLSQTFGMGECLEETRVEPLDQAVYGRRIEANIQSCCSSRRGDAAESGRQLSSFE